MNSDSNKLPSEMLTEIKQHYHWLQECITSTVMKVRLQDWEDCKSRKMHTLPLLHEETYQNASNSDAAGLDLNTPQLLYRRVKISCWQASVCHQDTLIPHSRASHRNVLWHHSGSHWPLSGLGESYTSYPITAELTGLATFNGLRNHFFFFYQQPSKTKCQK